jgi:hypothetical protein
VTEGFLQLKIEGPRGTVAQAQILANLEKVRASWAEDTFRAFGEYVRRVVLGRQFQSEGTYLGGGWNALDPKYLEWKISGGWMSEVGRRAGALTAALTRGTDSFTMSGPGGSDIKGAPILDAGPTHVTIGAAVTEKGREYSEHYDKTRPIMGTGRLPVEVQVEGGRLLSLPYLVSARTDEFGKPEVEGGIFPRAAMSRFITERALRQAV